MLVVVVVVVVKAVRAAAVGVTAIHVMVEVERWWWSGQRGQWQLVSPPFMMVVIEVPVEVVRVAVVVKEERVVAVGVTTVCVMVEVERWWQLA